MHQEMHEAIEAVETPTLNQPEAGAIPPNKIDPGGVGLRMPPQPWQIMAKIADRMKSCGEVTGLSTAELRTHLAVLFRIVLFGRPSDLPRIIASEIIPVQLYEGQRRAVRITLECGKESIGEVQMLVAETPETPWCCPVAALLDYLKRTTATRARAREEGHPLDLLFIGSKHDGAVECVGQECLSKHTLQ